MRSTRDRALTAGTALFVAMGSSVAVTLAGQQQPRFRSATSVLNVPVDVRVVDADGRPVLDLQRDDFIVLEDGQPQTITHFSAVRFDEAPATSAATPADAAPDAVAVPHRTFLIVLGRGRLQEPGNGVDGLIAFVRDRLLPTDQVAILAWNRATSFTSDHAGLALLLERFRELHEGIEARLAQRDGGLGAIYGNPSIPPGVQADIDAIFAVAGNGRPISGDEIETVDADQQAIAQQIMRGDLTSRYANPEAPGDDFIPDGTSDLSELSFDQYVSFASQSSQDLANIYAALAYLRFVDGEKHLLFVSQYGLLLPRSEAGAGVTALANDARVVIDTIHTGGLGGPSAAGRAGERSAIGSIPGGPLRSIVDEKGAVPDTFGSYRLSARSLRDLSEDTGGVALAFRPAVEGLRQIDRSSRAAYVLGYMPTNARRDGRYRRIEVSVRRPGLRVFARQGYFASERFVAFDPEDVVRASRITAAAGYPGNIRDIRLDVAMSRTTRESVTVDLTVDPSRIGLERSAGRHVAALDVVILCSDGDDALVGQLERRVDLSFSDEEMRQLERQSLRLELVVPITAPARSIKAIVYSRSADTLGSVTTTRR